MSSFTQSYYDDIYSFDNKTFSTGEHHGPKSYTHIESTFYFTRHPKHVSWLFKKDLTEKQLAGTDF